MARRTFIRLQLRKSSCDWVQLFLVDFIKRFPRYSKVVKNFIRLYLRKPSCVHVVSIPSIHVSTKKIARDYLYKFLSFSVHNFCARTDRHFSKKYSFFFLIKNIYTKVSIHFFILYIGMKTYFSLFWTYLKTNI